LITGIGLDLIELDRIKKANDRSDGRLWDRILSADEKKEAHNDPIAYLAGRFAAKEAGVKALGTGINQGIGWRDVRILNQDDGAPTISFVGHAHERFLALNADTAHVTITHAKTYAAAVVILEKRN